MMFTDALKRCSIRPSSRRRKRNRAGLRGQLDRVVRGRRNLLETLESRCLLAAGQMVTIDSTPVVQAEGDAGTTGFVFTVTRSDTSMDPTVSYTVSGSGTNPADGVDFGGNLPSGSVMFSGTDATATITIPVNGDETEEMDEEFTVTLSGDGVGATDNTAVGTITDDDTPIVQSISIDATPVVMEEGDSGTTDFVFTVTRTDTSAEPAEVTYAVAGSGTDAADSIDFGGSLPTGTVTFSGTDATATITIAVSGDDLEEMDEEFTVTLTGADVDMMNDTATGTITDDDTPIVQSVTIDSTPVVMDEGNDGETTNFVFTVTRTDTSAEPAEVTYAVAGSGADAADANDFGGTFPAGTVTFSGTDATATITIAVSGDDLEEMDEEFTVTLTGADVDMMNDTATGTITDEDTPIVQSVTIDSTPVVMNEGNDGETTNFVFTVTRTDTSADPAEVTYAVTGSGADANDFGGTFPSGTVTFSGTDATATITIPVSGDTDIEMDEGFIVTLTGTDVDTMNNTSAGTITDDDASQIVTMVSTSVLINEGDTGTTNFVFTVTRTVTSVAPATVSYTVSGSGTNAAEADDFDGGVFPSGTVTFSGTDATATITVPVTGDTDMEFDEEFVVTLSGDDVGSPSVGTGTIVDDDTPVAQSVTIDPTPVVMAEGDAGTTGFVFTVTRSDTSTTPAEVTYSVTGSGTGAADADDFGGTFPSGTVTFSGTDATTTITIPVTGDTDPEMDEQFTVALSGTDVGSASTGTGTITNDDIAPQSVTIDSTPVVMNEGDSGTTDFVFTVTRTDTSTAPAAVSYTVNGSGTHAADANDFEDGALPSGTVTFSGTEATATITVRVTGDTDFEMDEEFTVTLSGTDVGSASMGTGTITNDDPVAQVVTINATPVMMNEGDSGTTDFVFTVSRTDTSTAPSIINYNVFGSGGNAAEDDDFDGAGLPSGTVTFSGTDATATISVPVSGDIDFEMDEEFTVSLSGTDVGSAMTGFGIIINDDAPPQSVTIDSTPVVISEGDSGINNFVFTVTRTDTSMTPAEVSYTVTGSGTNPADDQDFDGAGFPSGTVMFSGTEATATISVPVSGDTDFESDEEFTVTLSGTDVGGASTGTGTITNDDVASQSVTIDSTTVVMNEGDSGITNFVFTVTRSDTSAAPAPVTYTVTPAVTLPAVGLPEAADANDFDGNAFPSGTVTFSGTEATATILIPVSGDTVPEADEVFNVTISGDDVVAGMATGGGRITNDDDPVITISPTGPEGIGDSDDLPGAEQPTSWSQQRSTLRQITADLPITPGTATASDVTLTNRSLNQGITLRNDQLSLDGMQLTISLDADQLPDGVYDLELGSELTGGDPFTLTGDSTNELYMLRGDWSGDGEVNLIDFSTFRYWFGLEVDGVAPLEAGTAPVYVDLNGDNEINLLDFSTFRNQFGMEIDFDGSSSSATSLTASGIAEAESTVPDKMLLEQAQIGHDEQVLAVDTASAIDSLAVAVGQARAKVLAPTDEDVDEVSAVDQLLADQTFMDELS